MAAFPPKTPRIAGRDDAKKIKNLSQPDWPNIGRIMVGQNAKKPTRYWSQFWWLNGVGGPGFDLEFEGAPSFAFRRAGLLTWYPRPVSTPGIDANQPGFLVCIE